MEGAINVRRNMSSGQDFWSWMMLYPCSKRETEVNTIMRQTSDRGEASWSHASDSGRWVQPDSGLANITWWFAWSITAHVVAVVVQMRHEV